MPKQAGNDEERAFLFDFVQAKRENVQEFFKENLANILGSDKLKVLHDGREAGRVLKYMYGIEIKNVHDTCVGRGYSTCVSLLGKQTGGVGRRMDVDEVLAEVGVDIAWRSGV